MTKTDEVKFDCDDDMFDGVLFRFWIRAASEFPGETAIAITRCLTPADYRLALAALAIKHRINFPVKESGQ